MSLLCRLKKLVHKGVLKEKDLERIVIIPKDQEPCEDCISRNAIIKTLNEMDRYIADELTLCESNNKYPQNEVFIVDDVYEQIAEHLPSVTPKPKTGHWINGNPICPCCGEDKFKDLVADIWSDWQPKYCPNCGAKMESEETE